MEQAGGELRISVAVSDRKPIDTIVKLELDGPVKDIAPLAPGKGEVPPVAEPKKPTKKSDKKK